MTPEEFLKNRDAEIINTFGFENVRDNFSYIFDDVVKIMEEYAQSKEDQGWKEIAEKRGKIMQHWIKKYNLPISNATLDESKEVAEEEMTLVNLLRNCGIKNHHHLEGLIHQYEDDYKSKPGEKKLRFLYWVQGETKSNG